MQKHKDMVNDQLMVDSGQNLEEFLSWEDLSSEQKRLLFEVIEHYLTINYCLRKILALSFADFYLAKVIGAVLWRTDILETGCSLGRWLISDDVVLRSQYAESFDWQELPTVAHELDRAKKELREINAISWWYRLYINFIYRDWGKTVLGFAKSFLYVFLFLSLIYVLIATDFGRGLSWEFLGVYGVIVKILMGLLLVVALVTIVILVSFMYFESGKKK
ncbi:MAG TPA: hypothetical protein PLZ62_00395 [bacterium]|nr:hypothetical protein [bacterium]